MQTTIEKDGDGDREIILKCVWTNASYSLSLDYFDYKLTRQYHKENTEKVLEEYSDYDI
jgi:hypothetical protein